MYFSIRDNAYDPDSLQHYVAKSVRPRNYSGISHIAQRKILRSKIFISNVTHKQYKSSNARKIRLGTYIKRRLSDRTRNARGISERADY